MNFKFAAVLTALLVVFVFSAKPVQAQTPPSAGNQILNTVTTAVPFLRIDPDARAGGMGEMGIAISPDANGWYHNPAKMAFVEDEMGFTVTYTPWLKQLVNDIYLASLYGFKKIDDEQTVGLSLRYFSLGSIQFTNSAGQFIRDFRPNEFAIDGGYSRKLSDYFSTGIMLRFIYSNLAAGMQVNGQDITPGTAVAADISFAYRNDDLEISNNDAVLSFGLNISNIGSKITYTQNLDKDFIPSNIGLGGALTMNMDQYNQLTLGIDVNKLLVPTPDYTTGNSHRDLSVPSAILGSFSDAPDGFNEEMRELMYAFGLEYWYAQQFSVRAGYFFEHATKGNRKYLTVGLGLRYNKFGLDFSYLVPTTSQRNPLDNTLRFSLSFDFDAFSNDQG